MGSSSEGSAIIAHRRPLARSAAAAALLAVLVVATTATAAAADGAARVLRHGPRTEKVVALTFDDGWGRDASARILAVLVAEKVPATFFPYALAVRANPTLWRRVAAAGFPIGNHSWSHPSMPTLTRHEMEWQIAASRRLIESVTGVPMLRVFRPPYGHYDRRVLEAAAAQGFPTVLLWDASAGDTGLGPSQASVIRGATAGRNGSVVLLHAARAVTAGALRDIIRSYRSRGFRFVTVPELLGAAAPWPSPSPSATPEPGGTPAPTDGPGPTATPVPTASPGPTVPPVLLAPALAPRALPLTSILRLPSPPPGPSPRTGPIAS
jgi:peptidoglycan/xylan/chitin deacetylase (PgdA/CDA1 family)